MNIAAFAVDPGGRTGLDWAVLNPLVDPWAALKTRMLGGSATVQGDARTQITEIASLWSSFYNSVVRSACLPPERVYLLVEDFVYAPGVNYEGESARISTQIIWGLEGYRMGRRDEWLQRPGRRKQAIMPPMILQTASQAKSYATAKRFRDNDCWERGFGGQNEHIFSARQHIAYFLQRYRTIFPG